MNKWFLKSKVRAFTYLVSALSGSLFGLSACTKSAGDAATGSSGSDLTISGGFSSVSLSSVNPQQGGAFVGALAASDYKVICAIMVDPFTTGNSSVDADSTFSVTIPGGAGQPIGCMMVKAGALVASFEFAAASTGMTGATGGDGLSVNSGTTAIQLPKDLSINGAKITVPSNGVTQNSNTAPSVSWVDPTGTWNIAAACMTEINSEGVPSKNCMAPGHDSEIPSSVYLKQIEATNGTDTKKGMSVWSSAAARNSCGDKEGINLEPGWTAIGGWAGAMTGVLPIDLHDDAGLLALSSKAKVKIRGGATVCNKTTASSAPIVDGTTTCNSVDWGTGDWGMSAIRLVNCIV